MRTKLFLTTVFALPLLACSGGGADTTEASSGPIEIHLAPWTEAAEPSRPRRSEDAVHAFVTLARVEARRTLPVPFSEATQPVWTTVLEGPITVDLLAPEGVRTLGVAALPVGATQLRLVPASTGPAWVETADGFHHALVTPRGQAAITVVGSFDVGGCAEGTLTVELAGPRSATLHPADAEDVAAGTPADVWVLTPLVRLEDVALGGACPSGDHGWKHGRVLGNAWAS